MSNSKRRGRGEGSIYEVPDKGMWAGTISLGVGPDGARRRKTVYGATKRDVQLALAALRQAVGTGHVESTRDTLAEYVRFWLANHIRLDRAPNTHLCYEETFRLHIEPVLGRVPLNKLTASHVLGLLAQMKRDQASDRMRQLVFAVLRSALNYAVTQYRVLPVSPLAGVKGPTAGDTEPTVWTQQQMLKFLTSASESRLYPLLVLAMSTGMRQGELLGLQWSSVDLDTGTLKVEHNLVEQKGKVVGLYPPKSEAGKRTLSLGPTVVAALKAHRRSLLKDGLSGCSYVFPSLGGRGRGTPILKRNLIRSFYVLLDAAGVPQITFHNLRHTAATLLIGDGVDMRTVQGVLGHANVTTTMGIYARFTAVGAAKAAASMEARLTGATKE